ncbi:hypothetical protein Tco_1337431 [Tanacetum coccineum]
MKSAIRDLIDFGVAGEAKTTSTPTSPTSQAQVTYVSESVSYSKFEANTFVVRCLLIESFPESALNEQAGKMLLDDYEEYAKHAREKNGEEMDYQAIGKWVIICKGIENGLQMD